MHAVGVNHVQTYFKDHLPELPSYLQQRTSLISDTESRFPAGADTRHKFLENIPDGIVRHRTAPRG